MDVTAHLQLGLDQPSTRRPPYGWRHHPGLAGYRTTEDVVHALRQLDANSDAAITGLLSVGRGTEFADWVILVGLLPHAIRRGGATRDTADDIVAELALVIGEARAGLINVGALKVGYRILNRMQGRLRLPHRRLGRVRVCDVSRRLEELPSDFGDPTEPLMVRCEFDELRARVDGWAAVRPSVGRAWETMREFLDDRPATTHDYDRHRYARRVMEKAVENGRRTDGSAA